MIASAHILSGLVCGVIGRRAGSHTSRMTLAFVAGLVSHVMLDGLPHSDYGSLQGWMLLAVVALEIAASLAAGWYVLRRRWSPDYRGPLLAGVVASTFPDAKFAAVILPAPAAGWVQTIGDAFHSGFHAAPAELLAGLAMEIVTLVVLLLALTFAVRLDPRPKAPYERQ